MYDADLLAFGVRHTHDLDRAFGLPPKITASQRDVPGLTRTAVPVLAYQGVKAISGGRKGRGQEGVEPGWCLWFWVGFARTQRQGHLADWLSSQTTV